MSDQQVKMKTKYYKDKLDRWTTIENESNGAWGVVEVAELLSDYRALYAAFEREVKKNSKRSEIIG